jgi:hypothetical protein
MDGPEMTMMQEFERGVVHRTHLRRIGSGSTVV